MKCYYQVLKYVGDNIQIVARCEDRHDAEEILQMIRRLRNDCAWIESVPLTTAEEYKQRKAGFKSLSDDINMPF